MEQQDLDNLTPEQLEQLQEEMEDAKEEEMEDQLGLSQEVQEAYGSPVPDEKHNAHSFLNKAVFDSQDTVRTTFLTESELGRPLFNVRFLSDLYDIARYYLDPILVELKQEPKLANGIAIYFWEKTQNITHSGMSNKGFAMNLNVTQKKDMTRKKIRPIVTENLKGGKK